jgi:hypothetical protein
VNGRFCWEAFLQYNIGCRMVTSMVPATTPAHSHSRGSEDKSVSKVRMLVFLAQSVSVGHNGSVSE